MKTVKRKVGMVLCRMGLHAWVTKAIAKKNGKEIKIQRCAKCNLDRYK